MTFAFQLVLSSLTIITGIFAGVNLAEAETDGWGRFARLKPGSAVPPC